MIRSLRIPLYIRKFSEKPLVESLGARAYTDPIMYNIERKNLLGPSWQLLTHESRFVNPTTTQNAPATYIAETVCGWPIIAIKNYNSDTTRAFHNVCRHKAGPFEWDGTRGVCALNGLRCKYHGWTFSMDGALKGMPRFTDGKETIDKSNYSLWPVRVARWRGLVFIQTMPSTGENVVLHGPEADAAFVEENKAFCDRLTGEKGLPLEDYELGHESVHSLNCNWKV